MTWQQFQERQRNRMPDADAVYHYMANEWMPSAPRNYLYWQKYGAGQRAKRTW
ncbi:hypothetical protein EJ02DRAFT_456558 [Clathrospora elynae]|uniref:Uncharacterized protein n=1 Tax=Clathrospora elynae TaxID=706981 RepID=A0A6A5SJE5_9PLEO|nr:hypothetical protein EJ02DRAFT_456558 [Clathrospora elynae]